MAIVQCRQKHERRNVVDHLPEELPASVERTLKDAWSGTDADPERKSLCRLAASLQAEHPGAAAGLRVGLKETLTAQALGITSALHRALRATNPLRA